MAPEQIHQKVPISPQTDLYSLGVLLYELLTGELPYGRKEDIASILRGHVDEPPRPPRELRPELPEALEHLLLDLLEKAPAHRPASAEEVRQRLREIREALAPTAEHPRVPPRRSPSLPRSPQVAASRPHASAKAPVEALEEDDDALDASVPTETRPSASRPLPWRPLAAVISILAAGAGLVLAWPHLAPVIGSLAALPAESPEETTPDRSPVPAAGGPAAEPPRLEKPAQQAPTIRPSPSTAPVKPAAPSSAARTAAAQATPSLPADASPSTGALKDRIQALAARLRKAAEQEADMDTAAMGHLDRLRERLEREDSPSERAAVSRGLDELERLYLSK
jgi:serine/threonine protein kinase